MTRDVLKPKQRSWNGLAARASKEFDIDAGSSPRFAKPSMLIMSQPEASFKMS
jgi:hypothetical protein